MNENMFREILGESLRREFAEFDNAPKHRFSLRHRRAMKKIFADYEKKHGIARESPAETMPHYGLKQRIIFALVIIILMTLLTGWFIPIRSITEAQIDWLKARYDFPSMMMYTTEAINYNYDSLPALVGLYRKTDEYCGFLDDLVNLEIYSAEEVDELQNRNMPRDTRPDSFKNGYVFKAITLDFYEESPLEYVRDFVSRIERKIDFYIERSKDPDRAVEGDVEFAELIREECWELNHSFLELLEKLYADDSEEDDSENLKNILADLDKDDRRYLYEINKI